MDEFDFGEPPDLSKEVAKLQSINSELLVVIDTLQTNLRTAQSIITKHEPDSELFTTPSYKWCINYRPGSQ